MWMDAESDEEGRGDEYVPEYHGAEYDGADYHGPDYHGAEYDEERYLGADRAYWRRRFFILCGGVAALGVCAWLFPAAHQPSSQQKAAASASVAAAASRQALPAAAAGPAWPRASTLPDVYPTAPAKLVSTASKPKPKPPAKPKPSAKPGTAHHPKPTASASPAGAKTAACAPAHIVLSLFTSQSSYPKGAHPRFSVYAVSTAAAPCTLSYGAGSVKVVVTRGGHVVWNSAACKPAPAKPVRFTLGVPQVLAMTWDTAAAKPAGCAGSLPAGAKAALDAVAMSHGQSSPVRAFRMNG